MLSLMRIVAMALAGGSVGLLTLGLAQADEPAPLISKLSAPREVAFGEDAIFAATVPAEVTGTVRFSLKTYAGQTVWTKAASITESQASVVLDSEEADSLEKGSRVLVGTVNGRTSRSAYTPVRLRGRIFRDVTEAPPQMQPGDDWSALKHKTWPILNPAWLPSSVCPSDCRAGTRSGCERIAI